LIEIAPGNFTSIIYGDLAVYGLELLSTNSENILLGVIFED